MSVYERTDIDATRTDTITGIEPAGGAYAAPGFGETASSVLDSAGEAASVLHLHSEMPSF